MDEALLDTDILSSIMKGRSPKITQRAAAYIAQHGQLTFSIITRYEILRGLKAKNAAQQILHFDRQCYQSRILPIDEDIVAQAAEYYADLRNRGQLISDADLLIAATASVHKPTLISNNLEHFRRISELLLDSWDQ